MNRTLYSTLMATLVMLAGGLPGARAATSQATVTLNATFTAPPCTLDIGGAASGTVSLGALQPGSNAGTPFSLNVTCSYDRPSSLYATISAGTQDATPGVVDMLNTGDVGNTGSPVKLTLSATDKPSGIVYGAGGATDGTRQFCSGTTSRTCTLTPTVVVNAGTLPGSLTAAIIFTIVNP